MVKRMWRRKMVEWTREKEGTENRVGTDVKAIPT